MIYNENLSLNYIKRKPPIRLITFGCLRDEPSNSRYCTIITNNTYEINMRLYNGFRVSYYIAYQI